jgi:predicted  nucleic acid-binding Zn-ribbon protein
MFILLLDIQELSRQSESLVSEAAVVEARITEARRVIAESEKLQLRVIDNIEYRRLIDEVNRASNEIRDLKKKVTCGSNRLV